MYVLVGTFIKMKKAVRLHEINLFTPLSHVHIDDGGTQEMLSKFSLNT